jgi:transcriptional regulator with XRE-family HTH domain
MADRVGPAGKVLAANIQRLRKRKGLTFAELSARTEKIGNPIAVLGLRRIERAERRVDYDDLLALAVALEVPPVDLMVPALVSDVVPYPIGTSEYGCSTVYEWVRGGKLTPPDPEYPWAELKGFPKVEEMSELLQWLPDERRQRVLRDWVLEGYRQDRAAGLIPADEELEADR